MCNMDQVRRHKSVGRKRLNNVIVSGKVPKDQTMPVLNYEQDIIREKPSPPSELASNDQQLEAGFKITTKVIDQNQFKYMKLTQNKFSDKRNQFYRESNSEMQASKKMKTIASDKIKGIIEGRNPNQKFIKGTATGHS